MRRELVLSFLPLLGKKSLTSNRHSQSTRLLIRGEADNIQSKRNSTIDDQCHSSMSRHFRRSVRSHSIQFASIPSTYDALHECKWRHPDEKIERVQLESSYLNSVGHDGFLQNKKSFYSVSI